MFTVFVTHQAAEQSSGTFTIERSRFLEHTDEKFYAALSELSNEAKDCLRSWPCLLMQEGRSDEVARVVEILDISKGGKEISITIQNLPRTVEVLNNLLWEIRADLDLEQFEFSRNHWAVKERDLFAILEKAGAPASKSIRARFKHTGLPAATRAQILKARDAISILSHSEIDDLLLEAGIAKLAAGRELGGRRDRANAIAQYSLDNPGAVTDENYLFSQFLLRKAATPTDSPAEPAPAATAPPAGGIAHKPGSTGKKHPKRVFVVHGRNDVARDELVAFLTSVGLEAIVLHEQANMGRHLLTKFIQEAELVTFAVVVMTDDDVGGIKGEALRPRTRQNVILELGYFIAYLGQARVCALITPKLETPSDFDGIVYISMAPDQKWKKDLLRELKAAEMPVAVA